MKYYPGSYNNTNSHYSICTDFNSHKLLNNNECLNKIKYAFDCVWYPV